MSDRELVRFEAVDGIGVITVDNPPVNALSPGVPDGITAAVDRGNADPSIKAMVLIGAGRSFIAGADIRQFGKASPPRPANARRHYDVMDDSAKPVVAAIHGYALGGGLETALACHYRVAVPSAKVGLPEVQIGILPGAGGTQRLPRLIGMARAKRYIIESTRLSAMEAEAVGWVDRAVAAADFHSAVDELAGRLAKAPTFAIAMIKDAVRLGYDLRLEDGLEIEAHNFARAALSTDAAIGIMSFLSKQEPEFTGS